MIKIEKLAKTYRVNESVCYAVVFMFMQMSLPLLSASRSTFINENKHKKKEQVY
jgi:hypothetical protein